MRLQTFAPTTLMLAVLISYITHGFSARFNVVGSQNQEQMIRLKSQYDMEPGKVLKLPIDVPKEYISLYGTVPPRLISIETPNEDNVYGTGDIIMIELRYTIPVYVSGTPTLTLNTGCNKPDCSTKEVQTFVCNADRGKFAIRLEDQFLMNLDANITKEELKKKIEEFEGINTVTITYGDTDDRPYSGGNRACTSLGNLVTIVFDSVSFPQYDGDVPSLLFDRANTYADLRNGLNIGEEDTFLAGVPPHSRRYTANTTVSTEVVKGVQQRDGTAYYLSGNATNLLTFKFVAQNGDFTRRLEVRSIDFVGGFIYSPVTQANVSSTVPYFGAGRRYMSSQASALSFRHNISVTSAEPQVLYLTSPNADGVYTQGDVISIYVVYDLPVKVYRTDAFLLQLSTGAFDRLIPFVALLNPTTMEFEYTVQQGDTSDALNVTGPNALALNGGVIYRDTSTNETLANTTLPAPGTTGSLSVTKNIVISTLSPQIVDVRIVSRTGVYTAGDMIDYQVTYSNPIAVLGHPRLLIANEPATMDVSIRTAPYHPEVSYTRAQPSTVLQAIFTLAVNWDLAAGDELLIQLPNFSIEDPSGSATANRTLDVIGPVMLTDSSAQQALSVSALWLGDRDVVLLTVENTVPKSSLMTFTVQARSGLMAPAVGVQPNVAGIEFGIRSSQQVAPSLTSGLPLSHLSAIGFESLSLTISPPAQAAPVSVVWAFSVPEPLIEGDVLSLFLPGFLVNNTILEPWDENVFIALPYFNLTWYPNASEFRAIVTTSTAVLSHSIALSQYVRLTVPRTGVSASTVMLSAEMANNGQFRRVPVSEVTKVCALTHPSSITGLPEVEYLTKRAGATSAVRFAWAAGPTALSAGDAVVFVLPAFDASLGSTSRSVLPRYVDSSLVSLFDVSVQQATVSFTAVEDIAAELFVEIVLSAEVGLVVPATGIRPGVHSFTARVQSSHCEMSAQKIFFASSGYVMTVSTPTVTFTPSVPVLGDRTAMEFRFQLASPLYTGDMFAVTIPGFDREVQLEPYNHTVTSNMLLTTRFNRRLGRLEFTLDADFNQASVATSFYADVAYTSGYVVPAGGFANDAFQLSIESADFGALSGVVMAGPCLGFCTAIAVYSTFFEDQALLLSVGLSYGRNLAVSTAFDINCAGFVRSISVALSAQVYTAASIKYLVTPVWNANILTVTLPLAVASGVSFTVDIQGLELTSDTATEGFAPTVTTVDVALGGTASITLNQPTVVFPRYYFDRAELQVAEGALSNLTLLLDLPVSLELLRGDFVEITLPGFQVALGDDLSSSNDAVDVLSSSWDALSATVRFVLARTVLDAETVQIDLKDVVLPESGVASNSNVSGITYVIGVGATSAYQTLPRALTKVNPVYRVANASVDFQFDALNQYGLSQVDIRFSTNADLTTGDLLLVELPGMSNALYSLTTDTVAPITLLSSTLSGSAFWQQNASTVRLHVLGDVSAGVHFVSIDAVSSSLIALRTGIADESYGAIELRLLSTAAQEVFSAPVLLPCVGVCRVDVIPNVRKAGFPTEYRVNISLGVHAFTEQDVLALSLTDFTKKVTTSQVVAALDLVTLTTFYLNVTMAANTSTLTICLAANASAHHFQEASFVLPQPFGLLAPVQGWRPSQDFAVNWLASLRGASYVYSSVSGEVAAIGKVVLSELEILPRVPKSVAEYSFRFQFLDPLEAGDFMRVYLPDFVVPAGPVRLRDGDSPVSVVGVAAQTDELTNPDDSTYEFNRLAYLQVTMLADIPAGDVLSFFVVNASRVQTPPMGIYRTDSIPWISVVSATSPVTAVQIQNFARIGSFSPASLQVNSVLQPNASSSSIQVDVNYTVNCPLFSGDMISIHLPSVELQDNSVPGQVNVTSTSGVKLEGAWMPFTSTLNLTLSNDSYILKGAFPIQITLWGFNITQDILYRDDPLYQFSIDSPLCPVVGTAFDSSTPSFLESSAVVLDPLATVGTPSSMTLSFASVSPPAEGNIVQLILPQFTLLENGSQPVTADFVGLLQLTESSGAFHESVLVEYTLVTNTVTLYGKVVHATTVKSFSIVVPATNMLSLVVPVDGVDGTNSGVEVTFFRQAIDANLTATADDSYLPQSSTLLFGGPIQSMQTVYFFVNTEIYLTVPIAGFVTGITLAWSQSLPLSVGSQLVFELPGFTSATFSSGESAIAFSGSAEGYVSAVWDATKSAIILTVISGTQSHSLLEAEFSSALGFRCPTTGIPHPAQSYVISLIVKSAVVLTELVQDVTVVPVVMSSSLTFIAADEPRAFEFGGNPYIMQLSPGHPLISLDAGGQVTIDNAYYTIVDVKDNLLYLQEPYRGRRIFMGYPDIPVVTPPYRFADYYAGSGTERLIFRYQVRRDDLSLQMKVYQPSAWVNTNNETQTLDLNGGALLRYSQNPAVVAETVMPSNVADVARSVRTDIPHIRSFFTTTPSGTFSMGQQIDFHVQYNHSVVVQNLTYSLPALLLKVAPFGLVKARYSSGSGTDTIVFVYNVSMYDFQQRISDALLTTDSPIFQPLRVITGNQFNSLRRLADIPLLDADIDFPVGTDLDVGIPANISLVGVAEKVLRAWTPMNVMGTNFSAGDMVQVLVEFTGPVNISLAENSVPYVLLDVGRDDPGVAWYDTQVNFTTLSFYYEVMRSDQLSNGLYLTCTCLDYFSRTYIMLNGSTVWGSVVDSVPLLASVVLANTSDPAERRLDDPLGSGFKIDREIPYVLQVNSNLSYNGHEAYSPGTVALISVKFSLRVTVRGIIRLWLKAQEGPCPARYYSGNDTYVLNFLYVVSPVSGVARLDYTDVNALDVSDGIIYRYSDNPQIVSNTLLPRPGLQQSLGVQANNIIDTTPIAIDAVRVTEPHSQGLPYFAAHSLSLSLYRLGPNAYQYLSQAERRAVVPLSYLFENTTIPAAVASIQQHFENPLDDVTTTWSVGGVEYTRLLLDDSSDGPLSFTPLLRSIVSRQALNFDSYWWTDLQVRSAAEFAVSFDRAAHLEGAYAAMNTGFHLNNAFSASTVHSYFLSVVSKNPFKVGAQQERYRLSYGGILTWCIAVTADAKSVFSLQEALEAIPSLLVLEPNVVRLTTRKEGLNIITYYRMDFAHLPRELLKAVTGDALGGSCDLPATTSQVSLQKQNDSIVFEYHIRGASSILIEATQDLSPGNYSLLVDKTNGIRVMADGIAPRSLFLERFTADGALVSKNAIDNGVFVPRVRRSALAFSANMPNNPTEISVDLCFEPALRQQDLVTIALPYFDIPNAALTVDFISASGERISWDASTSSLEILILQDQAAGSCLSERLNSTLGFVLPQEVVLRNSPLYTFSVSSPNSAAHRAVIEQRPFELVTPVGISRFSVWLSDPRPRSVTMINVSFELVSDLQYVANDTQIVVYLPEFYTVDGFSGSVELGGPMGKDFAGSWWNGTSALTLTARSYLEKGSYTVSVLPVGERALYVPINGVSSSNAPSFSFNSSHWQSSYNVLDDYPSTIGHIHSFLSVNLTSDLSSYNVESLTFAANLSRPLAGPASITINLPFLTSELEKVVVTQGALQDEVMIWRNWEKTLTVTKITGWGDADVVIHALNLTGFTVNELGIPENRTETAITFEAVSADGSLAASDIISVPVIPTVLFSSFETSTYGVDVFNTTAQRYTFNMKLNVPAKPFDVFYFDLKGVGQMLGGNVSSSDPCVSLNYTGVADHTMVASLINSTECKHGTKSLSWVVTELNVDTTTQRAIAQYNTGGYYLFWENRYRPVYQSKITEVPTIGITYSAIEFDSPFAGAQSVTTIRLLTATSMRTGDLVRIELPGFSFGWTSTIITDNYGRLWPFIFSPTLKMLLLSCPSTLPPTALRFQLVDEWRPTLPAAGIAALADSKYASNDIVGQGNITIALSRGSVVIASQPVQQVTPVGHVDAFEFRPVRSTIFDVASQSVQSSTRFTFRLVTLSPLRVGDVISLKLPHYDFNYNAALSLDPVHLNVLQGRSFVSNKTMEITMKQNTNSTTLDVTVLGSNAITPGSTACNQLLNACHITVSIKSSSNPVLGQQFYSKEMFVVADATIKFYETFVGLTPMPTFAPTELPSSQPTRQPSSQPSAQPSHAPARSSSPTSQPSSLPSVQPSSQPTSQPSTQPSDMPTMQPSTQPTSRPSYPTSQPTSSPSSPTSQPSSQPTVQPSSVPSSQPSSLPSTQPSAQPSTQPTGLPSVQPSSQPSGQPSTQPSSQPTVMPTAFDDPKFVLVVELSFTLSNAFSKGSIFSVHAPNLYSNASLYGEPVLSIIEQTVATIDAWNVTWSAPDQSFHLVAMRDIVPGAVSVKLVSESVKLARSILYENDPTVSYEILPVNATDYVPQAGQFGTVFAYGLKNASLSFSHSVAGEEASLIVELESDDTFKSGDIISIQIPNYVLYNASTTLVAVTSNAITVTWLEENSTVNLFVHGTSAAISLELQSFLLPIDGSNKFVNEPTVEYFDRISRVRFEPSPFLHFVGVSHRANTIVTFERALAGQKTPIYIELSHVMHLDQYDVLALYLPQFWCTQSSLSVSSNVGNFSAAWDVSTESLLLQMADQADISSLELTVDGLRLPLDGVSVYVRDLVRLSSNSTRGGRLIGGDRSVQLVGYVLDSRLTFLPAKVDEPVVVHFGFTLGFNMKANEKILLYLPNFAVGSATPTIHVDLLANVAPASFSGVWDATTFVLTLETLQPLALGVPYVLYFDDTVYLPPQGIYFDSNIDDVVDVTCTISVEGAAAGTIAPTAIRYVQPVGLSHFEVKYDKVLEAAHPLSFSIQFISSSVLWPGDTITIFAPLLTVAASANQINHPLVLQGDMADNAFTSFFTGRFNATTQEIFLTVVEALEPREVHIFVTKASGLLFTADSANYADQTHYASAQIAAIGALSSRVVPHTPKAFFAASPHSVRMSNCALSGWQGCEWQIEFELQSELGAGESIAVSHPSFERNLPSTQMYDFTDVSSVTLAISGTQSTHMKAFWRSADSVRALDFAGTEVSLIENFMTSTAEQSAAVAIGDIPWYPVNLGVETSSLDSVVHIVPRIPRIVEVYATARHGQGTTLTFEDSIFLNVKFTEPVVVQEPQYLKLLLNTGEAATFVAGNATNILQFVYTVTSPIEVQDLEVFGPGALEYVFSNPAAVSLYTTETLPAPVPANLTIPTPYGSLLLNDGSFNDIVVSTSPTARIVAVEAYGKKFATYATGDILDVEVRFDRAITVIGTPVLVLNSVDALQPVYTAKYVNASSVQWLNLPFSGVFSLHYEGKSTPCMAPSDIATIQKELTRLPTLRYAMPLIVTPYASAVGYRYKLSFGGLAPTLLGQLGLTCDEGEVFADVNMEPTMRNSAVFRYHVKDGDEAEVVTYANTSALQLGPADHIYIAGGTTAQVVNVTLPEPTSDEALEVSSQIRFHTVSPHVLSVAAVNYNGTILTSGDVLTLVVTYSAPVEVTGVVELGLNFSSKLVTGPCCDVLVPAYASVGAKIFFQYVVQMGDYAYYLETSNTNTLYVTDGFILLKSMNSSRPANLTLPATDMNVTLPAEDMAIGLSASLVHFDAIPLPVVLEVFTNHSSGVFNAGEDIFITIRFSSTIHVLNLFDEDAGVSAVSPSIDLLTPDASMEFADGNGTTDVVFLYTVGSGEMASTVSFMLNLEDGLFLDPFDRTFTNLTSSDGVVYVVGGIAVDTTPATVIRVNSTEKNGTYYPGDVMNVYVIFSEPVYILGNGLPALELFLPSQVDNDLLAYYHYGNGTTELHFTYVVPPPNQGMAPQSPDRLDYANADGLYKHLNGSYITDVSTRPTTVADVFLQNADNSYLAIQREIYVDFTLARVLSVTSTSPDGIYSVGDEIMLQVSFSSPVMVILPPVLKLATGAFNRSARYVSGNFTKTLQFRYAVQLNDKSSRLDYIDTRSAPYRTDLTTASFALNTVVKQSLQSVNDTVTDVFLLGTEFGGVFMASRSASRRVPVYTALAIPGATGSLSASSRIVVDTSSPFIKLVTVPIASGTYGFYVPIPITVTYSAPVVVAGCPQILFQINGVDKFATYVGGSGTTVLDFVYDVQVPDSVTALDYFDRFSLKLTPCTGDQVNNETAAAHMPALAIMRKAEYPKIFANLTMPWVNYIESVIAPVSITGSGKIINIFGSANAPRLVWTTEENTRSFALGDIIDINLGFTLPVLFPDGAYLRISDATPEADGSTYLRNTYFAVQINATTVSFPLVVQHLETIDIVSYLDRFSLMTTLVCSIIDVPSRDCTAQNLPIPFSQSAVNSLDSLSTKSLTVQRPVVTVQSLTFGNATNTNQTAQTYLTGSIVSMVLKFADAVAVRGQPMVSMQLNGHIFPLLFVRQLSSSELMFQADVDSLRYQGVLICTQDTFVDLNGGNIYREANFLPLLPADLRIAALCCLESCGVLADVKSRFPVVTRVYSPQSGVFSTDEKIDIFVEFSAPITVIGTPGLVLELTDEPTATFVGLNAAGNSLVFEYFIQEDDFSSALDYLNTQSLYIASTGFYDGVYLNSPVGNISASLALPPRGALGSIGRATTIVVNKDRPNLLSAFALPAAATSGDDLKFFMRYSEYMAALDSAGVDIFESGAFASGESTLDLRITMRPLDGSAAQTRLAHLLEVNGTDVVFIYEVTANDPTGSVFFTSATPMVSNNVVITSALSGTAGPIEFSAAVAVAQLATIDNNFPYVVRVFSPNTSSPYPFGVGDVIDIYVEFSLNVVVVQTPYLDLVLNEGARAVAQYVPNGLPSVRLLHFQYTVRVGDSADPLEYDGQYALHGLLLRFSTRTPSIKADLTLPMPSGLGSLGDCCNVVVDSTPPYIVSLIPLKRAGIYGENETIYIMARFNKPVIAEGVPQLWLTVNSASSLAAGQSTVGIAHFVEKVDEYDIPINIRVTDIMFKYVVQRYDNVLSLHHTDENAIVYPFFNATIKHRTDSPTISADISLRDPTDHTPLNGRVFQQWKFRYPQSVEVLLRDFYHTKPSSITASVEHLGQFTELFKGCCSNKVFGNSYPKTRSGTNATLLSVDTGVGDDFLFSDLAAPNLAPRSIVTQSSTRLSAKRAIDGNVDPLVGDNSVSETTEEMDAWWRLQLPPGTSVRSMTIWGRKPQSFITPVVEITMKSYAAYPEGRFRLLINNIDNTDPSAQVLTDFIEMGTAPVVMQKIIESSPGIGNVAVTRTRLPLCPKDGSGCGVGFQSGYGFSYRLNFQSITAPAPNVTIVNIVFPGEVPGEGVGRGNLNDNVKTYPLKNSVDLIRTGYYIQVPEERTYGKGVTPPVSNHTANTGFNYNAWLTPFWVFLYTSVPPTSLNASVNASIWFQRYETMGDFLNINLPTSMAASYIKIQREGYGSLALAEFEVFEEPINNLDIYNQGERIKPSALTAPYQALNPFSHKFNNLEFDGRWRVQLTQDDSTVHNVKGWNGALGSISEAVLIITDLAGIVHSYYQDLRAEVTSLPKYGQLSYTVPYTEVPYGQWRDNFEVGTQGELIPKIGSERSLGYCYGPDTYDQPSTQSADNVFQACPNNFGVGPLLTSTRMLGDTPEVVYIRNERVVVYQPHNDYLGPDYFTYKIFDGQNIQSHEYAGGVHDSVNEVSVHVRRCRPFQSHNKRGINASESVSFAPDGTHALCGCAQTETSLVNNRTLCDAARVMVCTAAASDPVASRAHFLAMCLVCMDPQRGLSSGECQTQTIRAVSLLTSRGLCVPTTGPAAESFMDCSTETITEPGREANNYLTLKPPTLYGGFERLKNSFGAYGWYHTPQLT